MRVRFVGKGEGRGKVIIDEAHNEMNVRGTSRGKSEEAQRRKQIVKYASIHRHFGADIMLITQALANIDLQVRNLAEFHSEVRNFRRLPIIGLIARLFPGGQLFLRVTVWNDKGRTKSGLTMYGLSKRLANLYDTHALDQADEPDDVILLPSAPHERPERKQKGDVETDDIVVTLEPDLEAEREELEEVPETVS
jgi:hypothetical protein